ncbi:MAG: general secretion pathway protein GspK [Planctomycetaceae bacterium]|nr:general secretion pathway protein GspK [Planctomycetaceae bacterium]
MSNSRNRPRGFVLLLVFLAVILMTLAAYSFALLSRADYEATILAGQRSQSRLLVDSGAEATRMFLAQGRDVVRESGGLWDNPNTFQGRLIRIDPEPDPMTTGYFSIIAPGMDDAGYPSSFRFGMTDESTKLNLNILPKMDELQPGVGVQLLMTLPEMTEDVAEAILDWIDLDDEPREMGAESGYYAGLSPAYLAKNGALVSVEELLLVRGVTPELLFGNDVNRNGILDQDEITDQSAVGSEPDMQLGWANFLTIFSQEANKNWEGLQRIDINKDDLQELERDLSSVLPSRWVNFILAYRINGPYAEEMPADEDNGPPNGEIDLSTAEGSNKFTQLLDLVDARTSITFDGESTETVLESPVSLANPLEFGIGLASMMDNLTTVSAATIPGRINIMQAPRRVLEGIPGLTPEQVEQIITYREYELNDPEFTDLNRRYETWLLAELIVDLTTMKAIAPFVCCKGDVYRAEIIGYFENGEASSRAEVVYDTTEPLPRLLFWRDKSHLPIGQSVQTLGIVPSRVE